MRNRFIAPLLMVFLSIAPAIANEEKNSTLEQVIVLPGEAPGIPDEILAEYTGQKAIRTFQDVVDLAGKAAATVVLAENDVTGVGLADNVLLVTTAVSAGMDVVDTFNCYVLNKGCD